MRRIYWKYCRDPAFAKTIEEIEFKSFKISDEVIALLAAFPKLKSVIFRPETYEPTVPCWTVTPEALKKFLQTVGIKLQTLVLGGEVPIDSNAMQEILSLTNLETLKIENCKLIDGNSLENGYALLDKMTNLKSLTLLRTSLGQNNLVKLCSLKLENLVLDFDPNKGGSTQGLTRQSLPLLCHGNKLAESLTSFSLSGLKNCKFQDANFQCIGNLKNLRELHIKECDFLNDNSFKDILKLGKETGMADKLEILELHKVGISTRSLEILSGFSNLRLLGLVNCPSLIPSDGDIIADNSTLATNLDGLAIGALAVSVESLNKIANFEKLKVFSLGNDYALNLDRPTIPPRLNFMKSKGTELELFEEAYEYLKLVAEYT